MLTEYIVLDDRIVDPKSPFYADIESALERLKRQGLAMTFEGHEETGAYYRLTWSRTKPRARLRMWDDYRSKVKYLELQTGDAATMEKMRSTLEEVLEPPPRKQLVSRAKRARSNRAALMRVVYSASEQPDEDTESIVTSALEHKSPVMREIAAYGAGILGWPAFTPALERTLKRERDARAKHSIEQALAMMPKATRLARARQSLRVERRK
jgi:hypothetical protein